IEPGATLQGTIEIRPSATLPREGEIERFELFVEEQRQSECPPDGTLTYNTAQLGDGHHKLRVVAVAKGPAASQGRAIIPVVTANHGRTIETELIAAGSLSPLKPIVLKVDAPRASAVIVLHNSQLVGKLGGPSGEIQVDPARLGRGPVRLRVVGIAAQPTDYTWAKPIDLRL
ncbi:MAG: hypothetical protein ACOY3P_26100, partial [Planctomycetota bacterium]